MPVTDSNLLAILEALDVGVCIVDRDHVIDFMNRPMIHLFGDGIGKKCHAVTRCGMRRSHSCVTARAWQGEEVRFTCDIEYLNRRFDVIEVPLQKGDGRVTKIASIWKESPVQPASVKNGRSAEEDYVRLFEHVGCGVFISTKEGKMLDANQAFLDMLGYRRKSDFLAVDISRDLYSNPKDRKRFQKRIEREGQVTDYPVVLKTKDGRPVPVSLTSHVRFGRDGNVLGYEGIVVDLTHQKLLEQKLQEAYDFLENIIHSSPNAIMANDMKGNAILWNSGAEEILGYRADEMIGKKNIEVIYPKGALQEIWEKTRSPRHGGVGKLRSVPMILVRKDGQGVEGNLSAAILYDDVGAETASVALFVDLEERLRTERKLMETQAQLFQAEKLTSIGRLAAGVAHELNNPLGAIVLYSHLVLEDFSEDTVSRQNLEKVIFQADRCKRIVESLLDFARQRDPEVKLLDINNLVTEALALVEIQGMFRNISVIKKLDPDIPPTPGDSSQLQQVFLNLAINAAETMAQHGTLVVESKYDDRHVEIRFTDNGRGLSPEDMGKIFEPFFTTKAERRGTGLGLSVSHGIVVKHGGALTVTSEINQGSTFSVRLPTHREKDSV